MSAKCDNCHKIFPVEKIIPLEFVQGLGQRLDPGSEVPFGDCPECGAFCYLTRFPSTKSEVIILRGIIKNMVYVLNGILNGTAPGWVDKAQEAISEAEKRLLDKTMELTKEALL